jgi:membrane-associated phospholipid phosphatase
MHRSVLLKKLKEDWFFVPALIVIIISIFLSLFIPRENIHIAINRLNAPFTDLLFEAWTWLGDGIGVLVIVFTLLWIRIRYSLMLFAGYAISGISVQLLKLTFFSDMARPVNYFELHGIEYDLYQVPGVDPHLWHSFPSGHTATAFSIFFGLSLILRSKAAQLASFVFAAGVAYSRIYLSQHFLMDVTAGASIGLVGGYLGWWWIIRYESPWLNQPLQNLFTK